MVPVSAAEGAGRNLSILDPVGEFIWRRLEGPGSSFQEVLEAVLEEFDVDRDTASRDIREFLCELQNNQYLSDEREEQQ